jgi:hypothetical protein
VKCTCSESAPEPWQRPLLSQRRGARLDAQASRVQGGFVNGKAIRPGDIGLELHNQSRSDRRSTSYDRWQAMQVAPTRGDAWRWGDPSNAFAAAGGGGNAKVGPGWSSDAPRFDAGEVEVLINGERCIQDTHGAWLTADGAPCPLAQER